MRTIKPTSKKVPNIEPYVSYTPEKIAVNQYDLKGKYIQPFESINAAAKKLKISASLISNCINNKAKSAGGFQWRAA